MGEVKISELPDDQDVTGTWAGKNLTQSQITGLLADLSNLQVEIDAIEAQLPTALNPLSTEVGGTGLTSPAASRLLITNGSAPYALMDPLTTGKVVAGITSADPAPFALIAGSNITIGVDTTLKTITFNASTQDFSWNDVTATPQNLLKFNAYRSNAGATLIEYQLPLAAASVLGDVYIIQGYGPGLFKVLQNAGQIMRFGIDSNATTLGTAGYIQSDDQFTKVVITYLGGDVFNVDITSGNISAF